MMVFANIFGFGNPVEMGIIAVVVLLLFGGTKLAGFGKSLGEGMKEFKKATKDMHDEPVQEPVAQPSGQLMMEDVRRSADGTPHTAEATTNAGATATKE